MWQGLKGKTRDSHHLEDWPMWCLRRVGTKAEVEKERWRDRNSPSAHAHGERERNHIYSVVMWKAKLTRVGKILNVICHGGHYSGWPGLVQRKMCLIFPSWGWGGSEHWKGWPLTTLMSTPWSSWLVLRRFGAPQAHSHSSPRTFQSVILATSWLHRLPPSW